MSDIICAVCHLPLVGKDYNDRHQGHEERCPRYLEDPDDQRDDIDCDCDVNYHASCCPDCNKPQEIIEHLAERLLSQSIEIDALKRECNLLYASINKPGKYQLPPKKEDTDYD